jgi:hypothetical protein
MSILAKKTESKVIRLLAQCLPYFDELANLKMTAEDAFDVRQAENNFHRIVKCNVRKQNEPLTMNCFPVTKAYLYVLVVWPEVQELMEYEWFRPECILYQAVSEQQYFDSAYFVPLKRIIEIEIN